MTKPTAGSLFSGIGGLDLGLEQAGWNVQWQVEINPFARSVLRRHWPDTERRVDIRTNTNDLPGVDLICGGFPCQDVSIAGHRKGLAGSRSGLFFRCAEIIDTLKPRWILIENVPGLLSSNNGRDFAVVLHTLAEMGYWWAYRLLDSQYFGIAQRRRRIFIIGHLGEPCPPSILLDFESDRQDTRNGEKMESIHTPGDLEGHGGYPGRLYLPRVSHTLSGRIAPNNPNYESYVTYEIPSKAPNNYGEGKTTGVSRKLVTLDGKRGLAIGNAVSVPVARWICERILAEHKGEAQ